MTLTRREFIKHSSIAAEAAHEKRESVSNKIRKLKLSRFN